MEPNPVPTVAVVMPVRQDADQRLLNRALESCWSQDLGSRELVVLVQVDGDAPDELVELIRRLDRPRGSTLRVDALGEWAGPAAARNVALAYCGAGWAVATLDADDELLPRSLESRARALASGPLTWCAGRVLKVEGGTTEHVEIDLASGPVEPDQVRDLLRRDVVGLPPHPAVMTRAANWWSVGGFMGLPYGEDDVALSALLTSGPGLLLDAGVYLYERGPTGESRRRGPAHHHRVAQVKERWRRLRAVPDAVERDDAGRR